MEKRKKWISNFNINDQNPKIWCMDVQGTIAEKNLNAKNIWIISNETGKFNIEIFANATEHRIIKICNSVNAAKRWVTQNLFAVAA